MTDEKIIEGLVRASELFNLYLTTPLASTDVNAVKAQLTSGWQETLRGKRMTFVRENTRYSLLRITQKQYHNHWYI